MRCSPVHARAGALALVCAGWFAVVAAAGVLTPGRSELWEGHARAKDPPQLWSIEAVPSPQGWRAVQICTDSWMRSGFARPDPVVGDQPCAPMGEPLEGDGRLSFQCKVNGQVLGATSTVWGDLEKDFTARFAVTSLGGHLAGRPGSAYEQTLRYRRLGPCPSDWAVGEHTDRHGRRQPNAMLAHSSQTAMR